MAASLMAYAGLSSLGGMGSTSTRRHQEPDNRGRRAEKDADAQEKAAEKRRRKAAKRLDGVRVNDTDT